MNDVFAGLEVYIPPPGDDLIAVAREAALAAFWAADAELLRTTMRALGVEPETLHE